MRSIIFQQPSQKRFLAAPILQCTLVPTPETGQTFSKAKLNLVELAEQNTFSATSFMENLEPQVEKSIYT